MNLENLFQPIKKAIAIFALSSALFGCQPHVDPKPETQKETTTVPTDNPDEGEETTTLTPPIITSQGITYDYTTTTKRIVSKNIESLVGGSIEVTDTTSYLQGTKLIIPIGALSSNTEISVGEVNNPPELPQGLNYIGSAINLEPNGINFNKNIQIKIPYTDESLSDAGIPDDSNLKLYSYNLSTKTWEQINLTSVDTINNFLSAEINHFSYYAITGLSSLPPSDLGIPLPGDLLYTRGAIGGSYLFYWSWMPGHVGTYVGEKTFEGVNYNVVHAVASGVVRSYFNPISKFSEGNVFMGAREPKSRALTSQQRIDIVNYVEAQVGKKYAWEQTVGSAFGTLPGDLVKGPSQFNCVGLAEKAYELAGVNNGEGLVSEKNEEKLLTPVEQYNSTKPASGKTFDPSKIKTLTIELGTEGKDSYIVKSGYPNDNNHLGISYRCFDKEYLETLSWKNSATQFEYENILIQFSFPSSLYNLDIFSAKLRLYGNGFTNSTSDPTIKLRKVNQSWEENTPWSDSLTDGVDISSSVVGKEGWYEWETTSLVKEWINGIPNNGLSLYAIWNTSNAKFKSSEYSDSSKRPRLIISYQE
ncbi:MAG: DNRLRE domain-containing protein [Candidatus Pacearchaeota archaeon]